MNLTHQLGVLPDGEVVIRVEWESFGKPFQAAVVPSRCGFQQQYLDLPYEVGTKQGSVLVTVPQMPQVFELSAVEELLYVEGVHTKSPCLRRKVLI